MNNDIVKKGNDFEVFTPKPRIKDGLSAKDMTRDEWYALTTHDEDCRGTLEKCEEVLDSDILDEEAGYVSIEHYGVQAERHMLVADSEYGMGNQYECEIAIDKAIEALLAMKTFNRNFGL